MEAVAPAGGPTASEEFLIWTLDHMLSLQVLRLGVHIRLANATAVMLNEAARQMLAVGANRKPVKVDVDLTRDTFAALVPEDRQAAISFLENLQADLSKLPIPFRNSSGFVRAVVSNLPLLTTFSCYSEWSGYGSSRLASPNRRKLESFPHSWQQVGYPGPAKGYPASRGFLFDKFTE